MIIIKKIQLSVVIGQGIATLCVSFVRLADLLGFAFINVIIHVLIYFAYILPFVSTFEFAYT